MRFKVLLALFAVFALGSTIFWAEAQDEPSIKGTKQADFVFQDSNGIAIKGYDAVAFFEEKKPRQGKKEWSHRWKGATWQFVSRENRDRFAKEPEKYAPQYGGYCAYGMSNGYAAPIEPDAWTVVDGKLYLNYNLDVRKVWNKDIPGHIAKADENWPKIPKKPARE